MLFEPSISSKEVPAILLRALEIGTVAAWKNRADACEQQVAENPLMESYLERRFTIELAMARIRRRHQVTHRWPDVIKSPPGEHRLLAFAAMLAKVYEQLSNVAQARLAASIRGALRDDAGLASIAFELLVASHMMTQGVAIDFHDLDGHAGFDFLARHGDLEAEIECKAISGDIGRKIHLRRQYQLGGLIREDVGAALQKNGTFLLNIVIPDRLNGSDLTPIAARVKDCLASGAPFVGPSPCELSIEPFDIAGTPLADWKTAADMSEKLVSDFLAERFGLVSRNFLVVLTRKGLGLVSMRSRQPDSVLKSIQDQLKRASRQLTESRPGIVCAHLLDLQPADIIEISRAPEQGGAPTGLHTMMADYFQSVNRNHVYAVKLSSPGELTRNHDIIGPILRTHSREMGPSYILTNNAHPLANDPRMKPFV